MRIRTVNPDLVCRQGDDAQNAATADAPKGAGGGGPSTSKVRATPQKRSASKKAQSDADKGEGRPAGPVFDVLPEEDNYDVE